MLQAKSNKGKLVTLARLPKQMIERYRQNYQFYCPVCNERVIVKAGIQMIPHFAHMRKMNCLSQGGEGPYHNKGKLLLYQWLKSQQLQVELEKYIPYIQQQPDLLLTIRDKKIAIEFQCARIPASDLQQRLAGYKKLNIQSIWILAAERLQKKGHLGLKMDTFTRLFIHQYSSEQSPKLFFFCPKILQFIIFQDFYHTTLNQAIGRYMIANIKDLKFTSLFKNALLSKRELFKQWVVEKKKFRLRRNSIHVQGSEHQWQQWLYLKQSHREYLPSFVYLPVANHFKMKSAPWNWQSRLCLDMIEPMELGHVFSLKNVFQFLRSHIHSQHNYPLASKQPHPILNYLHLLERLDIIRAQSHNLFMKQGTITQHNHIEQSLYKDQEILKTLYNSV